MVYEVGLWGRLLLGVWTLESNTARPCLRKAKEKIKESANDLPCGAGAFIEHVSWFQGDFHTKEGCLKSSHEEPFPWKVLEEEHKKMKVGSS